jgi:ABC-type uncharacterized transport system substrate-binding protein
MRAPWQSAALALVLLMVGEVAPASAHPHVWITDVTTFVFEDRKLVEIASLVWERSDLTGEAAMALARAQTQEVRAERRSPDRTDAEWPLKQAVQGQAGARRLTHR